MILILIVLLVYAAGEIFILLLNYMFKQRTSLVTYQIFIKMQDTSIYNI